MINNHVLSLMSECASQGVTDVFVGSYWWHLCLEQTETLMRASDGQVFLCGVRVHYDDTSLMNFIAGIEHDIRTSTTTSD
jgi:hypothetical protein